MRHHTAYGRGRWARAASGINAEGLPTSHDSPEVLGPRQWPGLESRPREERRPLVKRGHGEAASGAALWVPGVRVTAEVAEDAGDGHGDNQQHRHHPNHRCLHDF